MLASVWDVEVAANLRQDDDDALASEGLKRRGREKEEAGQPESYTLPVPSYLGR